jgi:DNA-3-methyladenine glycosylase
LVHDGPEGRTVGRIVETEAYDETDPASHCYGGRTERTRVMFGPGGYAYVYRSYGIHWCFNITAGRDGFGAAVLVRAVEPLEGRELMVRRRGSGPTDRDLSRGPGRLTRAMGIDRSHYGVDLISGPLRVTWGRAARRVVATPRVGITRAVEEPWRFVVAGNRYVSGPLVS